MRRFGLSLALIVFPWGVCVQAALAEPPPAIHVSYSIYAAGVLLTQVDTSFGLGPSTYWMHLDYRTLGIAGILFRGRQSDRVEGAWHGGDAVPSSFTGQGHWHGEDWVTDIAYPMGSPVIRRLSPLAAGEREPVPDAVRDNSIDSLSALAQLIHDVGETGRCETAARTFDGRRALAFEARTAGQELLEATSLSSFAGQALRCDFSGRMVAGFKVGDNRTLDTKPVHGSVWLAPVVAGGAPLPVRMTVNTRWFGDTVMYLTDSGSALRAGAVDGH